MLNHIKRLKWLYVTLFFLALNQTIIFGFSDLKADDPDTIYIEQLKERGLTNGYPDGTYRPEASITRSELVALVNRAFAFEVAAEEQSFKDVSSDQWFEEHVRIASYEGYINGFPDKTFRPFNEITRGEVAVILSRIMELEPMTYSETSDVIDSWALNDVQAVLEIEVMSVDDSGAFNAKTPITRGEVASSLIKALDYEQEQELSTEEIEEEVPLGGSDSGSAGHGQKGNDGDKTGSDKENPSSEVVYALNSVVKGLEDIEEGRTYYSSQLNSTQMGIIKDVDRALEKYLKDYSYDYDGAMSLVRADIKALSEEKKELVKLAIKEAIPMQYEELLRDFFKIYEEV